MDPVIGAPYFNDPDTQWAYITSAGSVRAAIIAGARPKRTPVASDSVNPNLTIVTFQTFQQQPARQ